MVNTQKTQKLVEISLPTSTSGHEKKGMERTDCSSQQLLSLGVEARRGSLTAMNVPGKNNIVITAIPFIAVLSFLASNAVSAAALPIPVLIFAIRRLSLVSCWLVKL